MKGLKMKYLIVVDMQNDFITGSLGSGAAKEIVSKVAKTVKGFDGRVIFTRDTHDDGYLSTQEGKKLPVPHCIKGTSGYEICDELKQFAENVIDKPTFGSLSLPDVIKEYNEPVDEIYLCGLCTDICVISNAMILKAAFPETRIVVYKDCSAGVTKESHETALSAMRAVQIEVE